MADLYIMLAVFFVSLAIGFMIIAKVPPRLHTPLMSMTNAISAVTILGAFLIFSVETSSWVKLLGLVAMGLAAFNVVGGFVITDRMLRLFRRHERQAGTESAEGG